MMRRGRATAAAAALVTGTADESPWHGTVPTAEHQPAARREAPPAPPPSDLDDVRVVAVMAVLRGSTIEAAASRLQVEPELLARWVGGFVTAGTAAVTQHTDAAAEQHRRRLLAAVSAEVAGPLAEARGCAEPLVLSPDAGQAETGRRLTAALDELAARMSGAELLVASALGGVTVTKQPTTIAELCRHLPDVGPVGGRGPEHRICVDPDLFARVLGDVWRAAHLEPAPASVQLYVRNVGPWVELRVLRQGEPIDTDLLQTLFEPFDRDHHHAGVTLGLYLARTLTVAHGGTLGLDQDDRGAAFWIRVPAPDPPPTRPGSRVPHPHHQQGDAP